MRYFRWKKDDWLIFSLLALAVLIFIAAAWPDPTLAAEQEERKEDFHRNFAESVMAWGDWGGREVQASSQPYAAECHEELVRVVFRYKGETIIGHRLTIVCSY